MGRPRPGNSRCRRGIPGRGRAQWTGTFSHASDSRRGQRSLWPQRRPPTIPSIYPTVIVICLRQRTETQSEASDRRDTNCMSDLGMSCFVTGDLRIRECVGVQDRPQVVAGHRVTGDGGLTERSWGSANGTSVINATHLTTADCTPKEHENPSPGLATNCIRQDQSSPRAGQDVRRSIWPLKST